MWDSGVLKLVNYFSIHEHIICFINFFFLLLNDIGVLLCLCVLFPQISCVCVCFNLTIWVHCIDFRNCGLCVSYYRLIKHPLVFELTTKPIQYKDSIFMPYFIYRSNLLTSTSEILVFWNLLIILVSTNT